jgi:hypothetical protein
MYIKTSSKIFVGWLTNEAIKVTAYDDKNKKRKNKNSNVLPGILFLFFNIDLAINCQIRIVSIVQEVHVNQKATQLNTISAIPIMIIPIICNNANSTILSCNDFFGMLFTLQIPFII